MRLEIISRYPPGGASSPPLVFVHGACHGAWCWDVHFLDYFARRGLAAHALSLRGHGTSEGREALRWTRVADYVEDVAQVVRELPHPPVLIGHSMGGLVVEKYIEDHPSAGAVLLAAPPPTGLLTTVLRIARRHPVAFAKVNLTLSLTPILTPRIARRALFSDKLPEVQALAHVSRLQDESFRAFLDMIGLTLPAPAKVRTPILVLGGADDAHLRGKQIAATARAYRAQAGLIADLGHDMMLDARWEAVAARILAWLIDQKLATAGVPVEPEHA